MDSLLVAGAETMVGANFAVQLAEQFDVTACFFETPRPLAGCESINCSPDDAASVQGLLRDIRPGRLVYCGAGANSAWTDPLRPEALDIQRAELWLTAARDAESAVTLISSDAVFTGPWMFHAEKSQSFCSSPEAQALLAIERRAQEILPDCLILRTNAFGWSGGWLETLLHEMDQGHPLGCPCVPHASPILVNQMIDIVVKSWQAGLDGLYHLGGAERTNPAAFAQRLAAEFGLTIPRPQTIESLSDRSSGYGQSETSLQTRKIRRALGISVPLLSDGLRKLRQLSMNGFRDRLNPTSIKPVPPVRAA